MLMLNKFDLPEFYLFTGIIIMWTAMVIILISIFTADSISKETVLNGKPIMIEDNVYRCDQVVW